MLFLIEKHPQPAPLLQRKPDDGSRIRIALVDPESPEADERDEEEQLNDGLKARIRTARLYFGVLGECPGVEIHYHRTPMCNSIFRADDQMCVMAHLYGVPGYSAPVLYLRRKGGQGMFDSFAAHFEAIWLETTPAGQRQASTAGIGAG